MRERGYNPESKQNKKEAAEKKQKAQKEGLKNTAEAKKHTERESTLKPELWENEHGEKKEFSKVILGHLDTDTISAYCLARDGGHISSNSEIQIANRTKKGNLENAQILTLEVARTKIPSVRDLQRTKETLESLGIPTTEIDTALETFKSTNEDEFNAKIGNITHEDNQMQTATMQVHMLTGSRNENKNVAELVQSIEVTRDLRIKKNEKVGPSYAQVVNQIIKKHTPEKGRMPKESQQQILDECYSLFQNIKNSAINPRYGIPVEGTPFEFVTESLREESKRQQELLKTVNLEKVRESGVNEYRIGFADGSGAERGVFGKINQLRDEDGRPLSEVTVLKAAQKESGANEVKIAVHKSLQGRVNLEMLAKMLNAVEVSRGITMHEDDRFGGHYLQFIGSPKESGTSLKPEEVYNMVVEYFEQHHIEDEEILEIAESIGLKGARIIYMPGLGPAGLPERGLEYIDTQSTALSPELYGAGVYGDLRKTVRESQIDTEVGQILTNEAYITQLASNNHPEKALKFIQSLPAEEARMLMSSDLVSEMWAKIAENPSHIFQLYTPERSDYLTPKKSRTEWKKSRKDLSKEQFSYPESIGALFEKNFIEDRLFNDAQSDKEIAATIIKLLDDPRIHDAFTSGEIYGSLHIYALAIATGLKPEIFKNPSTQTRIETTPISSELSQEMYQFIVTDFSTAETKYIISLIEKTRKRIPESEAGLFEEALAPLLSELASREDIESIRERTSFEAITIENNPDNHPRQVAIIQVGRSSNMKDIIGSKLSTETEGEKSLANFILEREGLIEPEEEEYILETSLESIENIALNAPDGAQIEVYIQAPLSLATQLATEAAKRGIDVRFGTWKDGEYQLS